MLRESGAGIDGLLQLYSETESYPCQCLRVLRRRVSTKTDAYRPVIEHRSLFIPPKFRPNGFACEFPKELCCVIYYY